MKVSLLMIWPKVSVFISMLMEANMLGIGIKINNMVSVKKSGTMVVNIKDSIKTHQKRVKVNTVGQTVTLTLVNGETTC